MRGYDKYGELWVVYVKDTVDIGQSTQILLDTTQLTGDKLRVVAEEPEPEPFQRHMLKRQAEVDPESPTPGQAIIKQTSPSTPPQGGATEHLHPGSVKHVLHIGEEVSWPVDYIQTQKVTLGAFMEVADPSRGKVTCALTACEGCPAGTPLTVKREGQSVVFGWARYIPSGTGFSNVCTTQKCTVDMMLVEVDQSRFDIDPRVYYTNRQGDKVAAPLDVFTGRHDNLPLRHPVQKLTGHCITQETVGAMVAFSEITRKEDGRECYRRALGVCSHDCLRVSENGDCGTLIIGYPNNGRVVVYGVVYGKHRTQHHEWGRRVEFTVVYPFRQARDHLQDRYGVGIEFINTAPPPGGETVYEGVQEGGAVTHTTLSPAKTHIADSGFVSQQPTNLPTVPEVTKSFDKTNLHS